MYRLIVSRPENLLMGEVFGFAAADGRGAHVLGGKGAGLAAMAGQGLNVPPGFIITTQACNESRRTGGLGQHLLDQLFSELGELERSRGRRLGDPADPLLLAVRSGAPVSMPGMMDTVLNLGINDATRAALGWKFGDDFAWDSYRRFLESFATVVLGVDLSHLSSTFASGETLVAEYRRAIDEQYGPMPEDPRLQLTMAVEAVFRSWDNPRAVVYRGLEGIDDSMGTAVVVQSMVFGNRNQKSGTGVVFTRDPNTGERTPYGDFLFHAQGEDVVSGRSKTLPISALRDELPEVWSGLMAALDHLERWRRDMLDVEFTIEDGELFLLQVRSAKRSALATVRSAVSFAQENLISRAEALQRVRPAHLELLARPHLSELAGTAAVAQGLAASPGVAIGAICLSTDRVLDCNDAGEPAILVRQETSPDDVYGMSMAEGILTGRGGLVSHAAVVARSLSVPAVVGVDSMSIDSSTGTVRFGDVDLPEGTVITIDGGSGVVARGALPVEPPAQAGELDELLSWADTVTGSDHPGGTPSQRLIAAQRTLSARREVPIGPLGQGGGTP
jgi:pyruvate,orthophosphate dikinase